jgi:hypothetical protein
VNTAQGVAAFLQFVDEFPSSAGGTDFPEGQNVDRGILKRLERGVNVPGEIRGVFLCPVGVGAVVYVVDG